MPGGPSVPSKTISGATIASCRTAACRPNARVNEARPAGVVAVLTNQRRRPDRTP
ncbi:MAG: hypothetical protein QOI74_583 [Micromonosporaceae bacterium]|nr:hypothetical protein [Micromonosporaceae bacterium]